uniref:Uncharacterized protein MANES_10G132600 n=1 Tax=Rhizophora mucronata TaxID=61149 RepID=A0A2P2Q4M2_RHIMU
MASFFRESGGGGVVDAKQKRHKPRLDRRNAIKNIDYDASSSSSSPFQTSSSFDLDYKTSFRIKGIEGEFDLICQNLGFSGPEDFAIPTNVWEAQKDLSSSLISSRLRRNSAEADAVLDHYRAGDDTDFKTKKNHEEEEEEEGVKET